MANEIEKLNRKHFLVPVGSPTVVGSFDDRGMLKFTRVDSFKIWYSNRFVPIGNDKFKKLGDYWLGHSDRHQYDGIVLVPNGPKTLPGNKINLWRGYGVKPKKGNWALMRDHILKVLANNDPLAAEYIIR